MPTKWTPPEDLSRRYLAGEHVLALSIEYGIARQTIRKALVSAGIRPRGRSTVARMRVEDWRRRWWSGFRYDRGGCWIWIRGRDRDGYGIFRMKRGDRRISLRAHRVGYEMLGAPIPRGNVLDHMCRHRACVNPWHLRPVTHRQNVLENSIGLAARNSAKKTCLRGHSEWTRDHRGDRRCRACSREWQREHRRRTK
jgi:hypothetical protein